MKKRIIALGLSVAAASVFAFSACDTKNEAALASQKDVLGMGAVTTVELLGEKIHGEALNTLSCVRLLSAAEGGTQTGMQESQAQSFHSYFSMLDSLLGDDVVNTSVEDNEDEKYSAYAYKLTVNGKNMQGESVTHVMYYNESEKSVKEDAEDGEVEKEYSLTGVMVADGVDYLIKGERSEEREKGEREDELVVRAYLDQDNQNTFVQMTQEYSEEEGETEKEYVYTVVENGKVIEQTAVEFEKEKKGARQDVCFEIEFRSEGKRGEYSVEKKTDKDGTKMKVEYKVNGKKGEFYIRQTEEGAYEYTFEDGRKEIYGGSENNA